MHAADAVFAVDARFQLLTQLFTDAVVALNDYVSNAYVSNAYVNNNWVATLVLLLIGLIVA